MSKRNKVRGDQEDMKERFEWKKIRRKEDLGK